MMSEIFKTPTVAEAARFAIAVVIVLAIVNRVGVLRKIAG